MNTHAHVTVVSASDPDRLAAVTAAVALACTSVPDGDHALSVSSLKFRSTDGLDVFDRFSLKVVASTPELITGSAYLVYAVRLPILCATVA